MYLNMSQERMNKNRIIEDLLDEIQNKVNERIIWEKKNLGRNKTQFSRDSDISNTTLNNFLKGKCGLHLSTAVILLYESGYRFTIKPL